MLPPLTVLMICMGNICRSPMMERLLLKSAGDRFGPAVSDLILVHGAGTGGWHAGGPMDPAAARQLRDRGADPAGFVARQLRAEHIESADLVLTATIEQSEYVVGLVPDAADRTFVLGEATRLLGRVDLAGIPPAVPDPDSVYARGVAVVEALAKARGSTGPSARDEVDDPWGGGEARFCRVADSVERSIRSLADALLG